MRRTTVRTTFSDDGLQSTDEFVSDDGTVTFTLEKTYNADGKPTRQASSYPTNPGANTVITYTYDDNGNVVEKVSTNSDGEETRTTYTYDANGNVLTEDGNGPNGMSSKRYTYDDAGRETSSEATSARGTVSVTNTTYQIDNDGNVTSREKRNGDGELTERTNYRFDGDDRVIQEVTTDGDGELKSRITYTYDDEGNLVSRAYFVAAINSTTNYYYQCDQLNLPD